MSSAPQCTATTKQGTRCPNPARAGREFCFIHDPEAGAARARAHRRGGRARHTPHSDMPMPAARVDTDADCRALLAYGLAELLAMENSIARDRAIIAGAQTGAELLREGEFEQRLAALEARLATGGQA